MAETDQTLWTRNGYDRNSTNAMDAESYDHPGKLGYLGIAYRYGRSEVMTASLS